MTSNWAKSIHPTSNWMIIWCWLWKLARDLMEWLQKVLAFRPMKNLLTPAVLRIRPISKNRLRRKWILIYQCLWVVPVRFPTVFLTILRPYVKANRPNIGLKVLSTKSAWIKWLIKKWSKMKSSANYVKVFWWSHLNAKFANHLSAKHVCKMGWTKLKVAL